MSHPTPQTGLDHFQRLNPSIYYHSPPQPRNPSRTSPSLIILLGWMNAPPKHLSKYVSVYTKQHPSARIVVVTTSTSDILFRSKAANLVRLGPVLEMLYSISNESVLLHLFSNGGGLTATVLAKEYVRKTGHPMPLMAMVLDSSPGRPSVRATRRAFAVALPKNLVLQLIGNLLFTLIFMIMKLGNYLGVTENVIQGVRDCLNDSRYFGLDVPRLYVFSEADRMVEARDVENHAVEAKGKGYEVLRERFGMSGHAAHMIEDPERYWGAVGRLWDSVK
ncbi:indole-diterpene biosynthesis protein PaxU [Glarea lozoyensis ATCC 20868]|uniref:Indole-diterpene biosynthesis protein PaxU n=1 Tax=Glarea lozoyensis (strain ATCC 20868 / MF5171) TaxID=1116229 RepID=S3DDC5_GLAL2|nr:indole-diterpene biosynthesis protein PaxU [Glarea lozoyensis ATCC 20868]EPE35104.1 indole-diterpene biosynthesis protein PaxU [Glarea lozoyensis ATCC 20868]